MDAFFASVEVLDDPSLAGRPVIVGGLGPRGVVAAASYEARRFGVYSAMPMGRARRLCPHAAFIRPRGGRYREVSTEVFAVFREFTPLVEGLSLDEAFLDVTGSIRLFGTPREMAKQVKARIRERTGLTASVGVAHNKFLAKLASDARKPDGLFVVEATHVQDFLDPMPVARLWGIGKRTAPRLRHIGILTVGQLRRADPALLAPVLGKRTEHFRQLARGEDDRPVVPARADKSISREETFDVSLGDRDELLAELQRQTEQVARRLRSKRLLARTVTVKIRDDAFRTVTRSRTMVAPSSGTQTLYRLARALFERWRTAHPKVAVRLLGVGVSALEEDPEDAHDPGDGDSASPGRRVDAVLDRINERFGEQHVVHGQTLRRRKRD
jgi:DNA polymerase-4